jgi:geranylgeranyl pyrophosphate synthase
MSPEQKLMQRAINLIQDRGQRAVENSRQLATIDKIGYKPLNEAVKYFMDEFWYDFLHPALISIACEAVGGNVEDTVNIGSAIVLLAGAADIHDDIIDESKIKEPYLTVFGKFGRDIAILTGDALLLKGVFALHESTCVFSKSKSNLILESVKESFLELCGGELRETELRGKVEISKNDYLEIVKQKAAASETMTRIGAILGDGTEKEIELLGHYGRTYGVLMTIRNEFIDVFESDELRNRILNECLPIPILLACEDKMRKSEILKLLKKEMTDKNVEKILDLSMDCKETRLLVKDMKKLVEEEISLISPLLNCQEELKLLLTATLEDI